MIVGQVDSIKTTKDMCIRLVIDIDKDQCPADVITWDKEMVEIKLKGEDNNDNISQGQ